MKICVMGTPVSSGNRGVIALGAALLNLCSEASEDVEVSLLLFNRNTHSVTFKIGNEHRQISVVNARMSPMSNPRHHFAGVFLMSIVYWCMPSFWIRRSIRRMFPWIKAIAEADVVGDVRGGDSFSDIYGMKRFLIGFFAASTVLLVKGTMIQFPQTYGPYKSRLARWLARFLLKRSSVIIARDRESHRIAQELVGNTREVLLSPDVAFSLEPIKPERIELEPPLKGPVSAEVIGLNVNGLMYHGGYTRGNMFGLQMDYSRFLTELVIELLTKHQGELWLIPHTFAGAGDVESDPEASIQVRNSLPELLRERVRIVARDYDAHELKGIIGQCGFFVGSRMHSCIAALSQGVPCVGVAYSMKFRGVFESVGMEDWVVDGRDVTNQAAIAKIMELYNSRDSVRNALKERGEGARTQLKLLFKNILMPHTNKFNQSSEVRDKPLMAVGK